MKKISEALRNSAHREVFNHVSTLLEAADAIDRMESAIRDHMKWLEAHGLHWTSDAFQKVLDGRSHSFNFLPLPDNSPYNGNHPHELADKALAGVVENRFAGCSLCDCEIDVDAPSTIVAAGGRLCCYQECASCILNDEDSAEGADG